MATISDLQKGLVLHLTMNSEDVDSGKVRDRSAYDNHGTINGPTTGLPGVFEESFIFDGSDDYIDTTSSPNRLLDQIPVTGSAWFYAQSNGNADKNNIISSDDPGNYGNGFGYNTNGNITIEYHEGFWNTGVSAAKNQWHLGTLVYNSGGTIEFYLNGELKASNTVSYAAMDGTDYLRIGYHNNRSGSFYFDGKIGDVRIYDRALFQPEIKQLYNQRSSRTMSVGGIDTSNVTASGGNEYTKTVLDVDYKIHEFTSDGTFSVSEGGNVDVLIVAGGGGGGADQGGGGGGGGVIYKTLSISSGSYSITIGSGGSGDGSSSAGNSGSDSSAFGLTAIGGGGGAQWNSGNGGNSSSGGSGGGEAGNVSNTGSSGLQPSSTDGGFGNDGGDNTERGGAGGGGASTKGNISENDGANGGDGLYFGDAFSDDFGENGYFAGGGGGGHDNGGNSGGLGGIGGGADSTSTVADPNPNNDAIDNTGGGGAGGTGNGSAAGGDGGDGIVLIRYRN